MQLYLLATLLGHVLLAMGVGAHAEVTGRRPWRWVPLVALTGVLGVLAYALRSTPAADEDPQETANDGTTTTEGSPAAPEGAFEERPEWLDERPREKRLADPNSLHIDLPDGTTLTSEDQAAVSAAIEHLEEHPKADADDLCEEVFPEARAGYELADVWWTECVSPALEGLPDVDPPPRAEERELSFDVRELESHDGRQWVEASDGRRSAEFVIDEKGIGAASGAAIDRTSPGWMRLAYESVQEWNDRQVTRA